MRVIGYTADAAAYCPPCAIALYNGIVKGYNNLEYENTVDEHNNLYGFDKEGNEIHAIFSIDESPDDNTSCDVCHELIVAQTN